MPPASYHHGNLCRALLDHAAKLIAQEGVQAASLREVARRAGVSHAAPAHHFHDKAGLLAALAAEGHDQLARLLQAAAQADNPWHALRAAGQAYLGVSRTHPGHFAVMTRCDLVDPAQYPVLAQAGAASHGALRTIIERLVPAPQVPALADAAWALAHGLAILAASGAFGPDDLAERRVHAALDRFSLQVRGDLRPRRILDTGRILDVCVQRPKLARTTKRP